MSQPLSDFLSPNDHLYLEDIEEVGNDVEGRKIIIKLLESLTGLHDNNYKMWLAEKTKKYFHPEI